MSIGMTKVFLHYVSAALTALMLALCGIVPQTAGAADITVANASRIAKPIEALDTRTVAFIGTATAGPVLQPTLVTSWNDYKARFGDFDARHYLSAAVYSYFANGGKRAYIVRVASSSRPAAQPVILTNRPEVLAAAGRMPPTADYTAGLPPLEKIDGISLVAIPGQTDQRTQTALIAHCEKMLYRFAILDSQYQAGVSGSGSVQDQLTRLASFKGHAALYYPWLNIMDPAAGKTVSIPPSGAMAGLYGRNDLERGVDKAPANIPVYGIVGLERTPSPSELDDLNLAGVNAYRYFAGRGWLAVGDSTLAKSGPNPSWKYVHVKRLAMNIEESVYKGTQWAVFEPDNEATWNRMRTAISNFLYNLWVDGHLQGAKPADAYFVKCDRSTMTQSDIAAGRLICEIGIAATGPGNFVTVSISHQLQQP